MEKGPRSRRYLLAVGRGKSGKADLLLSCGPELQPFFVRGRFSSSRSVSVAVGEVGDSGRLSDRREGSRTHDARE